MHSETTLDKECKDAVAAGFALHGWGLDPRPEESQAFLPWPVKPVTI